MMTTCSVQPDIIVVLSQHITMAAQCCIIGANKLNYKYMINKFRTTKKIVDNCIKPRMKYFDQISLKPKKQYTVM